MFKCAACGEPALGGLPWCSASCRAEISARVSREQAKRGIRANSRNVGARGPLTIKKSGGRSSRKYRTDVTENVQAYERMRLSL